MILAGALVAGFALSGATTAHADGVGGGGVGGGGGGGQIASQYWLFSGDNLDANTGEPFQGWGQQSIDTFANAMEQQGGWANGVGGNRSGLQAACTQALDQANSRSSSPNPKSRVVQVGVSVDYQNGGWWMGWGGDQAVMRQWYQDRTNENYWQPNFPGHDASLLALVHDAFQAAVTPTPRIVCVALNMNEVVNYDLSISTDKSSTFSVAGQTSAVSDRINASASNGIRENVTARVTLNWGGVENNGRSASKDVSIANDGTTWSPNFTPSDFGWKSWPAGKFWFDVNVDKQGKMNGSVSHGGQNDGRENWSASTTAPRKILTSGPARDQLADNEVLASGMSYNAEITARTNGYSSSMTISDTIGTDKVWIGSDSKDVASAAYVLDPSGNKVSGASIRIDRGTGGKVKVQGTVTGIPNGNQAQEYTLVVPTYVQPTKADYSISDDSSVCYTSAQSNCIQGNAKTTRKVTPTPDKVWVIDADGALTAADPSKTNQAGVDEKVFAPGAQIGAVVNGKIAARLAENLGSYVLTDDWSGASKYIDFSDASAARVFLDGDDVTRMFDIKVTGTKTVATAKSEFLSSTKGLSSAKTVKLYIGGKFRTDYETAGQVEQLQNAGSEQVNNEAVDTNTPAIYTVTPAPNKAWVLDEQGGLVTVDTDKTDSVGADGKIFLQNDAISAVVNGSIPANLGSALTSYSISDDWTKAATYVDFSDASRAKVFYDGKDVTSGFTVNVVGTKTIATAKAAFLASTKGLAKAGAVKLIITGAFRDDYDTNGKIVTLTNSGSEAWNGKEVESNSPPVFVWTPDPNKQVLGSADESGDKAHADIDGASVWPGQKLEYSVGVDLRIPAGTARGVKTLAVEDRYDAAFMPDKSSVEFWDTRDASNPKPVARSNYKLTFDEPAHKFLATFTDAWIAKNVGADGANDKWLSQGWLTMRFTGTVSGSAKAGGTVSNQAFQIINGGRTATEVPVVQIPTVTPDKDSLRTDGANIDGKTVVQGDKVVYRLLLDGGPARDKLAYNVHKFGVVDDYDDAFLDVDSAAITVTEKASGKNVTDAFNVQVKDGVAYVFAKTVDTEGVYGGTIPGDPQPSDLKAFDAAAIRPLEDPIIDQSLLGKQYWVTLTATVTKAQDGHVIENQATQNIQNTRYTTKTVSNPIAAIDPSKDVVIDESSKESSLQGTEVRLWTVFNYRLNSSEIPAKRAYKAGQWSLSDSFDREHDEYTGVWAVYANTDVYAGEKLLAKKGELLEDSAGTPTAAGSGLFTATFDQDTYAFTIEATKKYLDLVEQRSDLTNAFSAYAKMIRIAPGEGITNQAAESYNAFVRKSNAVSTFTIEYPELAVKKFTLSEGENDGAHGDKEHAYAITKEQLATTKLEADSEAGKAGDVVQNGVEVGIHFSNAGDVPLKNITLTDVTHDGLHGELQGLLCAVPADPAAPSLIQGNDLQVPDSDGMHWVLPSSITELALSGSVDCRGTLREMEPGMTHGDTVVVTGQSTFSDATVKAEDSWFANAASTPGIEVVEYTLDEGREKGDRNTLATALELTQDQGKNGVKVGFDVTNTGDETLSKVALKNAAQKGSEGKVADLKWLDPVKEEEPVDEITPAPTAEPTSAPTDAATAEPTATPATASAVAEVPAKASPSPSVRTVEVAGKRYVERPVSEFTGLLAGERVLLVGTLTGMKPDSVHTDVASVTAEGAYSGLPVGDDDPWNAKLPALPPVPPTQEPAPPRAGAVTGEPLDPTTDKGRLLSSAALLLMAASVVGFILRRRARRWDQTS